MSNRIDDGGPAFPYQTTPLQNGDIECGTYGMSLRDYFAAAALQGWLASFGDSAVHPVLNDTHRSVARDAYAMADAMIKASKQK
jgi:hypothetical protein